jgi:hypothetical protein
VDAENTVAMDLAERFDVRAGRFEDPKAQEAQHRDQREVVDVRGVSRGGEECFELEVVEPQGR